ncbi:MAG: ABC transporter permease, partial [Acidobacteriota bacterium]
MDSVWQDLRIGARHLWKNPGFTAGAILTLAIGIGANVTLFSLVRGVLLRPLPYEEPHRLVRVWDTNEEQGRFREGPSSGNVVDWRRGNRVFDGIAAWYVMGRTLRAGDAAVVIHTAQVSADFFPVLRVRPLLGHTFTQEETARAVFSSANAHVGTDPVVVLSHRIWNQRFGADPGIIGQSISLERQNWKVIGILPTDFAFPDPGVEVWIPWSFQGERPRDQHYLSAIARLKPGVTRDRAEAEMNSVAARLAQEYPETNRGWGVRLEPLREEVVSASRPVLLLLLGSVGFVLLIGCANLASLQLARALERRREIAVRLALGATRWRLIRQFLIENLILAGTGGLLGTLIALWGVDLLKTIRPGAIPRLQDVAVDSWVLLFTLGITLATGLLFGSVPAMTASRANLSRDLKDNGQRGSTAGPRRQRLRGLLVVSEIAIAMILLVGAGLLVRSFQRLQQIDPGFRPENVLVLPIFLDQNAYDSGGKTRNYYRRLIEKLLTIPGVVDVGGATVLPGSPLGPDFDRPVWKEGDSPLPGEQSRADVRMVTTEYFRTLGIPVVRGRPFSGRDGPRDQRVVVINESLARRTWPGEDPIGRRLVIDYSTSGTYPYEVIGVVADLRFYGLRSQPRPEVYLPHAQRSYLIMNIAVRTDGDPARQVAGLRRAVLEIDPDQPAHSILPL